MSYLGVEYQQVEFLIREVWGTMRRRYRLLNFRKGGREYLSLVVEYQDEHGAWHSRVIKSYGQNTAVTLGLAQTSLDELVRLASEETDPIPIGTVDEVIWAGFYQALEKPLTSLPFIPFLAGHDLSHLAASVINSVLRNAQAQIEVTQPSMESSERQQFLNWLEQKAQNDQWAILAYQWKYEL